MEKKQSAQSNSSANESQRRVVVQVQPKEEQK